MGHGRLSTEEPPMITYVLTTDVLGNTRFSFSPLAEATLSLRLIGCPHPTHIHAPWLRSVRNRLDGVDLELLLAVAPSGKWVADCLMPAPSGPQVTIEEQLRELAQISAAEMGRDLQEVWQDEPAVPRRLRELVRTGAHGPQQLAETLWDYWDAALEPFWNKICAVLEDDVFHRVAAQMNSGLFALLEDLHPEVSLDGNLLHVDKPHHTSATYHGRELDLTPSVFAWPGLILRDGQDDRFGLTYAARGVARVWEGLSVMNQIDDDPLAALLGRTRAAILEMTSVPMSTTQIARELGQSAGSVSQHLSVLRGSGLVVSRRSGRSVLYSQTSLAQSMIAVQEVARPGSVRALPGARLRR
jgi:DNA-binding transcriptional ArsR family regulator